MLSLQLAYYFLVQKVWSLNYLILFVVFDHCVGSMHLYTRWTDHETARLRLVYLVPRVLSDLIDINSLVRISDENLGDHVSGLI